MKVPRRWYNKPINVNCNMEDLFLTAMQQNFVPVTDDDGTFIGIICRRDIMEYYYQHVCPSGADQEKRAVIIQEPVGALFFVYSFLSDGNRDAIIDRSSERKGWR